MQINRYLTVVEYTVMIDSNTFALKTRICRKLSLLIHQQSVGVFGIILERFFVPFQSSGSKDSDHEHKRDKNSTPAEAGRVHCTGKVFLLSYLILQ